MTSRTTARKFFDARGRLLLERRGLPRDFASGLVTDAYHFLRTSSWSRLTLLFAGIYAALNFVFASIYWTSGAVANATGFLDCYWFSVQTLATIGYGGMTPSSTFANTVVAAESFIGILFTALATGVFFSRFATPSARLLFSRVAVIGDHDGKRTLMFRLANARDTPIMEATVKVYVSRDELTVSGERVRRIYDLELRRTVSPIFALSWSIYHTLDERSPLAGLRADAVPDDINIIVTFQGIDDRLAANVHARWSYDASDLVFDRPFVDILHTDRETGVRYLDFTHFHDTASAADRRPPE